MSGVIPNRQRLFKRAKLEPAEYVFAIDDQNTLAHKIHASSFASTDSGTHNLFIADMSVNLVHSMMLILQHSCVDNKVHIAQPQENAPVYPVFFQAAVLGFNTLHAIFSPIHTAKSRLQHVEQQLVAAVQRYYVANAEQPLVVSTAETTWGSTTSSRSNFS